ncbi:MAG: hypothetical protein PWP24_1637 [Clostridiales bacterium]|nr:hypothetical protein [Clostridiales bacterium]
MTHCFYGKMLLIEVGIGDEKMRKHVRNKKTILILSIFMMLCLGTLIAVVFQYNRLMKQQTLEFAKVGEREYRYHCAFIAESYDDPFWESIYEGAKDAGEKLNIYV